MENIGEILKRKPARLPAKKVQEGFFMQDHIVYREYAKYLKATGLGVYTALCSHRNNNTGLCNPSIRKLSYLLGMDEKTIGKYLDWLEELGVIKKKVSNGRSTRYTLCSYQQLWENIPHLPNPNAWEKMKAGVGVSGGKVSEKFHTNKNKEKELNNNNRKEILKTLSKINDSTGRTGAVLRSAKPNQKTDGNQ